MRRSLLFLCALAGFLLVGPGRVAAHNSLETSTPSDGAVLDISPTQIVWKFANAVPLETLTVTLVDAAGVRTELGGSTQGATANEVITPLPTLAPGAVSVRWRLVGPDGHPVTDRVSFSVNAAPLLSAPPTTLVPASGMPNTSSVPPPSSSAPPTAVAAQGGIDEPWSTPAPIRWFLRGLAYLAIMVAAGVVITHTVILRDHDWGGTRRLLEPALLVIGVTALIQLLVVASDIGGQPIWAAGPEISGAVQSTDAGAAFMVRVVLALTAWLLLVHQPPVVPQVRRDLLMIVALAMLGTWSFAGHSNSMRWRTVGVPLDVVHHGAAAAWLGGLTIVAFVTLPHLTLGEVGPVMQRFSKLASVAVGLIVGTGVLQAIRLVGGPGRLLDADHGRLLAVKLVVLAAMLGLAEANRRRVNVRLRSAGASARVDVDALRRGMLLELVVGLLIIGVTAAMVVSPPATSSAAASLVVA
jgi:copper transport protein